MDVPFLPTYVSVLKTSPLKSYLKNEIDSIWSRDETIRSSHDTIRIDTKGDDMVIYDTIRVVVVKIQLFTIFVLFLLLSP